jgi:hypothetical protein
MGRAGLDPVYVEGRFGEGPQIELIGGLGIGGTRSLLGKFIRSRRELAPALELLNGRRLNACAQRFGQAPVDSDQRPQRPDQRVRGVQRRAPVQPGVEIASAKNSTIECPPVSSSPSQAKRTFTGSSPACAS